MSFYMDKRTLALGELIVDDQGKSCKKKVVMSFFIEDL